MQHDKIKPILFSVIKHSSKEELKKQLPKDIVSGIVVAVVALPLSIALAIASGVGPEAGLYTAIVAGFLIAFLGGSRVQISGPTAAFATIVAGIVATDGLDGLFAATIIAGIVLILMGVFKLGALIRFVPYTITTGFTAGIAVTIVIGQIKDLLGLTYPAGTPTVETTDKIQAIVQNIATVNTESVLVGLACLVVLFLWPKFNRKIPSSLIAIFVGIGMVNLLGMNVNTIGDLYTISSALPELHILPRRACQRLYHRHAGSHRIAAFLRRCRQHDQLASPLQHGTCCAGRGQYRLYPVWRHTRHRSHCANRRQR